MGKTGTDRRFNFTKAAIENVPTPKGRRATYYDAHQPNLGLLVQPTGHRSFFWFRKIQGNPTWKTIGRFPDNTIEQARNEVQRLNAKLATWKGNNYTGDGPFEKHRGAPTLDELVDRYIERHTQRHAKRPERAAEGVRWTVDKYLASWKNRKLAAIRRGDVVKLHDDIGRQHQVTANRLVQLVRRLFNWATAPDVNFYTGENPATRIKLFPEKKRTRFAQPDEMPRLFAALRTEPNPDVRDYVNLSLWTGARKSDVMSMRWKDVSLADNRWDIPEPKNNEPYSVSLTPEAVKILKDRMRGRRGDNPWVFPSYGRTGHVVDFKRAWKELLKRANITNLRQHDLRRTLGSWQAARGTSLQIIGGSLGHKSVQATQIYSQLNLEPIRESVVAATQAMLVAMKKKPKQLQAPRG